MDKLSKEQRSKLMASVKGSNTGLERKLRSSLWSAGIKGYRVNFKIRGTPDIYFPKSKLAIFVDGCFWHRCPIHLRIPKTHRKYWLLKLANNRKRANEKDSRLVEEGWKVVHVWEHSVRRDLESSANNIFTMVSSRDN